MNADDLRTYGVTEFDSYDLDELYEAFLNELYGDVNICGSTFQSGWALRQIQPTDFDIGQSDWLDDQPGMIYIDGSYWDADGVAEFEDEYEAWMDEQAELAEAKELEDEYQEWLEEQELKSEEKALFKE